MNLTADLIGSFSALEIFWVAVAAIGAFLSGSNARDAWLDLAAVGGITNGRRVLAIGWVRRESIRLVIFSTFILIGVLAGLTPAVPGVVLSPLALILVLSSVLLTLNSVFDRLERLALVEIYANASSTEKEAAEDKDFGEKRRELESQHRKDDQ